MTRHHLLIGAALIALSTTVTTATTGAAPLAFTQTERDLIMAHGPWPLTWSPAPGNRASGKAAAITLGYHLFFNPQLSANNRIACATCHLPEKGFQDGRVTARGLEDGVRNTPGLLDTRHQRWFGWDGANDSLWAATLRPILDHGEMNGSAERTGQVLKDAPTLACHYIQAFGTKPEARDPALLVNVAKAIAAWQETLVSPASSFDLFRTALEQDDRLAIAAYPPAAARGLRIFLGQGQCHTCHAGPLFSNGEFADTGMPFFIKPRGVDPGRQGGIKALLSSPYNLLGTHNDDRSQRNATGTKFLRPEHRNFGEFKVPSLRNLTLTAPYMHNGELATLHDVVRHYSELDEDRLHADGERILKPLHLGAAEREDLVAFLKSLSPDAAVKPLDAPAPVPECVAVEGTGNQSGGFDDADDELKRGPAGRDEIPHLR